MANAVSNLGTAITAVATGLIASGNPALVAEGEALLAVAVPEIEAVAAGLATSPLNSNLYPPQQIGSATGAVVPNVNPNAHYSFENSSYLFNVDMTVFQSYSLSATIALMQKLKRH